MSTEAEQLGLFDGPTTPTGTGANAGQHRPESNDLDLIRHVAGNAARGMYVLVGVSERVYARADGPDSPDVVRVPRYEEAAVHQLLGRRWLTLGGSHRVTCGAASLVGTAVLAPKATRARIARWDTLARPTTWPADPRTGHRPGGTR